MKASFIRVHFSFIELLMGLVRLLTLSMRKVITKIDDILRRFLLQGGFDIELMPQLDSSATFHLRVFSDYVLGRIPLYSISAACGYFCNGVIPEVEGWIDASGLGFTPNKNNHFVVHAKGYPMFQILKMDCFV